MTTQQRSASGERAATRRPASRRDRGFTFVELLITIVLMGTVIVGLLAATQALIVSSRTNREAASVESALIAVAEQVERAPRETYKCELQLDQLINSAVQVRFGLTPAEAPNFVDPVYEHLVGSSWQPGACPAGTGYQPGLVQRINITVISPDNGLERTLEVIKGDV